MTEPTLEPVPGILAFLPLLVGHIVTLLHILHEPVLQLMGGDRVLDEGIDLVVVAQAAGIEVRTAYGTELPIDHHDFRMVESRPVTPDMGTTFRQFLHVVDHDIGHQRDIVFRRDEDIHLHSALSTAFQGLHHRRRGGKVGIYDFHGVLGAIKGIDVETSHDLIGGMRLAIGDADGLVTSGDCLEVLRVGEFFLCHPFPHSDEDGLQLVDGRTFDAAMHIPPFAYLLRSHDIVVGNIHTACIAYPSIDDDNLTMVTGPDVVHPGKPDGIELIDLDAVGMQFLQMFLFQRLVVGVVAEAIELLA